MKSQISVIGCGWLGLTLAKSLAKDQFIVKGSTTSKNKLDLLNSNSIKAYLVNLKESEITGDYSQFLTASETIVINIPPGLRKNPTKNHVLELKHLMHAIEAHSIKNVLYISSTSVFKNEVNFPIITANTKPNATSNNAKQLIEIEQMFQDNPNFNTTILRFGGLVDETRHPSTMLSGRENVSNPKAPINLIHKKDCVAIIKTIIKNNLWNLVLNAVFPKHIDKETYYKEDCKLKNLPPPNYNYTEESKGKIIESTTLVQLLNYTFTAVP
ncbi:NAD(P)H-binding protein [Winogradskyella litoriviva]|uniref:NAD(P)H-binding protein n=1 Tax=Winogradskyella litoriviva TaxID=1220182 RepID=A0ABX2E1I3_9FLAO|nr:NAD(P)H-binding protein [Winogradskyella litoriviva]NRD22348.1 NAD(P)H-binding protein [Winogradskyella litoriviva]